MFKMFLDPETIYIIFSERVDIFGSLTVMSHFVPFSFYTEYTVHMVSLSCHAYIAMVRLYGIVWKEKCQLPNMLLQCQSKPTKKITYNPTSLHKCSRNSIFLRENFTFSVSGSSPERRARSKASNTAWWSNGSAVYAKSINWRYKLTVVLK